MFSLLKNQKITDIERNARLHDILTDEAIVTLHRCGYDAAAALATMQADDELKSADLSYITADETKKFGKGIRNYGKNFLKIHKELLPLHQRDQLVAFYYLWKKTKDATKPRALTRQRNVIVTSGRKKATNGLKNSRPASTELNDYVSASETDTEEKEAEGKSIGYACHHCYSSKSKDWHHAGRDRQLLCTDCRLFYKKYAQLRPVDRPSTVPPCLFKSRSPNGSMNGDADEECCCPPPPPPCCCPPPPCCCGGGSGGGGGLGGLFGRKKREIVGHTKKFRDSRANDCNSPEINAVINENLKNDPKEDSRRIHTILDQKFPNQTFTVFCSPSPVSYVAQTDVYCVDGNGKQNCYVFQM